MFTTFFVLSSCVCFKSADAQNAFPWESSTAPVQNNAPQRVQELSSSGTSDFGVRRQTIEEYRAEQARDAQNRASINRASLNGRTTSLASGNRTAANNRPAPAPPSLQRRTLFASARQAADTSSPQVTAPQVTAPQTSAPQTAAPQATTQSVIQRDISGLDQGAQFQDAPVQGTVEGRVQGDYVQQTQPSLSDPAEYEFDNVPSPPEGYQPANIQSPAPQLSVYDRASEDDGGPNYCYRDCRKPCQLGCVKRLFGTTPRGVEVGGWAQFGYHNRDTILYNNRRTEFSPHQIWLYAEKAACRNSCDWDIGYRLDGLYGLDAQDLQAFGNSPTGAPDGWDNGWDHGSFGSALPQAYVQLANADWDVKLGKFFGPFGYETPAAPGNFFYSHSYTNYYNEPRTMSGILGERRVSESKSYLFGVTAGWDSAFESNESGFNLITGTRMSLSPNVNLSMTTSLGDTGSLGSGIFSSAVAEMQLTQDLQYVFQFNNYNLNSSHSYAVVQYLFREINPCLGLGARLEWWKSDLLFADTKSTYEFTMGANYRPHANVIFRPEVRFDWGAAAVTPGEPIVGFDAILLF